MTLPLTTVERQLLRELARDVAYLIARPDHTIDGWKSGMRSGGSPWSKTESDSGFDYDLSDRGGVSGSWQHRHTIGEGINVCHYRFDDPHQRARITHRRCVTWAKSLPEYVRYQACHQVFATRLSPIHVGSFTAIATHALDVTPIKADPQAKPVQLDLFTTE